MQNFYVEKEPNTDDKYYIFVKIIIYRNLLGKYPDFLIEYDSKTKYGYTTKFAYLTEHTMLNFNAAKTKCEELNKKYSTILNTCETTGDWTNSPFDFNKMELLWCK